MENEFLHTICLSVSSENKRKNHHRGTCTDAPPQNHRYITQRLHARTHVARIQLQKERKGRRGAVTRA